MNQVIDAGALLDASPFTTHQKLLTALAALAVIFDGFDIQILAFAIPSLMKEWHAARADFGYVLAIGLAGMAIGGPVAGYFGDRFGRRPALIGSVALFGLATIATSLVDGLTGLAALRFLTGLGAGGAVPNAGALAAEFAPAKRRATAVKFTIVCIPLGGMLGGLIAARVLPAYGWRTLYLTGGALPLLFSLVLWSALAESPRFMARRPHRWPQLRQLLARMGHALPNAVTFEDPAGQGIPDRVSLRSLFVPALVRDTSGLWVAFFFCLGAVYLVFGWLPTLLAAQGLNVAVASSGLAVYNFGGVLGVLLWAVLTAMLGSRRPLLFGALGAVGSALALLWVPFESPWLIFGLGLNGLLANAVQTSMYALAAHIYPTSVRASGVAYAAAVGRLGGLLTSSFGAVIIQAGSAVYWITLAIAMLCTFAGLAWVRHHFPPAEKLQ